MSNDAKVASSTTARPKRWRSIIAILTVLVLVLWWPGVRVFYFAWITAFGTAPVRHADFSKVARVLPPADAMLAVIYRGLPHQMWERDALWRALFTTSNRSIAGYRFYTTPAVVSDSLRNSIATALRTSTLYEPYLGPKLCGGYHPDYCFEWHSSRGTFYALLCTGCREILLSGDGTEVHCDLNSPLAKELGTLLGQLK